jgi:hypothetical protein
MARNIEPLQSGLSLADRYEIYFSNIELINASFEFWMTSTFAILVAFHFAGGNISRRLYQLASFLYLLLTVLFLVRMYVSLAQLVMIADQVAQLGLDQMMVPPNSLLSPVLYIVIVVLGSVGTWLFMKSSMREVEDDA